MATENQSPEEILQEAVEILDPTERAVYLEQACGGDETLWAEIESLLRAHREAGTFLNSPALELRGTLNVSGCLEGPGAIIGRYKLLEQIGEGGMAMVYMAEQEHPIRRRVALKIIKLGLDTKEVIARFEAERQALALMDHPNIARVLDAGATETGRPYFVMELVRGIPITEYCDKSRLNTRQRLELFIQVCHAIQHAHQKGIIHRDIKPSNVLVTVRDGTPVPKVIDFGIAKATNQRLTEKTVFTRFAQMIGTPAYMSPEQAEMSELDVDTRSDVYSLGVLLYELLTGATPFDPDQLRQAGYAEIQRIIRETEPPKPSTRLSTLGQTLTVVAQYRQTVPETLSKLVRGDLDWIVMKTLEKDRTRRYETAHALGEDIERHLRHEPIIAGRPGPIHRCRKFVERNRTLVTGTVAVFVTLVAGLVGVTIFAVDAYRARVEAEHARMRAEEALEEVHRRDRMATAQRFYEEGRYREALAQIQSDAEQASATAATRLLHARVLLALGHIEEAKRQLEGLLTEPPEIAGAAHQLLGVIYADYDSTLAEEHRRLSEQLLPRTAEAYCSLAMTAFTIPQFNVPISRAVEWLSQALSLELGHYLARKTRALLYYATGDLQAMERDAEALIAIRPMDSSGYALRAISRRRKGLWDEALQDQDQAIRFCKVTSTLAEFHDQRRLTVLMKGDPLAALRDAKLCENLQPDRLDYQFNVFAALVSLGDYEAARKKYEAIMGVHPEYREELAGRARKYVFDVLRASNTLAIPEPMLSEPVFAVMQEAIDEYHTLDSKAVRVLPFAAPHMSWSPDGRRLAYARSAFAPSEIGTMLDSVPGLLEWGGIMILEVESGDTRMLVPHGNDPAWSPDGEMIAFANRSDPSDPLSEEVWLVPAKGSEPRHLALGGWPRWGSDSRWLFFHSRVEGALCRIDVSDPNAKPEILMPCSDWYPLVSRDGRQVAYQEGPELLICELPPRTAEVERWLKPGCQDGFLADWSPDGKELSFAGDDSGLWILDIERRDARLVVASPAQRGVWSPDRSQMSILVAQPFGDEIWLARLDPNIPTYMSLAPADTWADYVRSRCARCRRLVRRCPTEAEEHLAELTALGLAQFQTGRYEDTALTLKTVDELRRTTLGGQSRAVEVGLLAKALHKMNRHDEADTYLARLRQLFRRGTLVRGQLYMYDAEKALAAQEDRVSRLWRGLEMGRLAEVSRELSILQQEDPNDTWTTQRIEGLRCALAMRYCACAREQDTDSKAAADYEAALKSDPNCATAFLALGWLQATSLDAIVRDRTRAVENASRACELSSWENHEIVAAAAAISATAGAFDTARRWQCKAITLLLDKERRMWEGRYLEILQQYQFRRYDENLPLWELPAKSLVGWWTFDEGQGSAACDVVGSNHGALHNVDAGAWVDGVDGSALYFDGVDDWVEVNRPVEDDFTIAFWVRTTDTGGLGDWWRGKGLVDAHAAFEGQQDFGTALVGDKFAFGVGGGETLIDRTIVSESSINDDQWHHVAVTRESATGEMVICVDGRQEATAVGPAGRKAGSAKLRFGSAQIPEQIYEKAKYFQGMIDNIKISDCVLSVEQIARLARSAQGRIKAPGLVAHWKLDGDAQDSFGTNDGVVHGDPVWTPGRVNRALQFDGAGDYVDCGHSPLFDITDEITVAGWIKVAAFDAPVQAVVTKGDSSWRLQRLPASSSMCFHCNLQSGSLVAADGTRPVNDGDWHHVAGVFDGSQGHLYVDGTLDATTPPTPGSIVTNACPVWIGDNSEAPDSEWCGMIDDVRLYDRALGRSEISALAESDWAPVSTPPGLVSYWPGEGHYRDVVGLNHILTVGRAAPTFAPGTAGQAFHFDESSVRIISPAYGIGDLQQFTMALWVRLDSLPRRQIVSFLCMGREKAVLRYDDGDGKRMLHFYTRNANNDMHHIWAKEVFEEGAIHHIAGTYDGHAMRLYLDGVEVGECQTVGSLTTEADNGVEFGQDEFIGFLDEIQIYNRPLSASEIAILARTTQRPTSRTGRGAPDETGDAAPEQAQTYDVVTLSPTDRTSLKPDAEHYVQAPAVGIGNLQQFSIALWVKFNRLQFGRIQDLVVLDNKASLVYDGQNDAERLDFLMGMTDGTFHYCRVNRALEANVFHHVVGTYDGHAMRLFLNGRQVDICTPTSLSLPCSTVCLSGVVSPVCGVLDEVQIYDRALSAQEVQELHASSGAVTPAGGAGPISWWHLDETVGTTAHDCVGPNDGTVHGAAWTTGKAGGALRFGPQETENTTGPSEYGDETAEDSEPMPSPGATTPRPGPFALAPARGIDHLQKFTLALWVKLNAMPPHHIQRFLTLQGEKAVLRYDGVNAPPGLHFYMRMTDDSWSHVRADDWVDVNAFHHIAGTYDGQTMRLYLDGAQVGACETTGLSIAGNGIGLSCADEALYGELDEVQIYDRVLNASEIQGLYSGTNAAITAHGAEPMAWWRLDEIAGTVAHDSIGSNDAVVHGATWVPGKFKGALRFRRVEDVNTSTSEPR